MVRASQGSSGKVTIAMANRRWAPTLIASTVCYLAFRMTVDLLLKRSDEGMRSPQLLIDAAQYAVIGLLIGFVIVAFRSLRRGN